MSKHKFAYKWNLSDGYPAPGIEYHGKKVFGTFVCGGGSTMGYKLAGYDHLGGVEIDPPIADVYKANHNPKLFFEQDIRIFNLRDDLPAELYNLDLLDGSPPCSSFSMAGNREKDWGKKKQFREGQSMQRLDDLVFEYVRTIQKLQPKVAILENVKGLIQGNAKVYTKNLKAAFEASGYKVQVFLLNAASMGVPQKRERVFFIGQRNDLKLHDLKLRFEEKAILFREVKHIFGHCNNPSKEAKSAIQWCILNKVADFGKYYETIGKRKNFSRRLIFDNNVCDTLTANNQSELYKERDKLGMSQSEVCQIQSFPLDFSFKEVVPGYLCGMSVPPVMTAQISHQIYLQWLSKLPEKTAQ